MVTEIIGDTNTLITSIVGLVTAISTGIGLILAFIKQQELRRGHDANNDKIVSAIDKAAYANGRIDEVTKKVDDNKDKIDQVVEVATTLSPAAKAQLEAAHQKIADLAAQMDAVKAQVNTLNTVGANITGQPQQPQPQQPAPAAPQ